MAQWCTCASTTLPEPPARGTPSRRSLLASCSDSAPAPAGPPSEHGWLPGPRRHGPRPRPPGRRSPSPAVPPARAGPCARPVLSTSWWTAPRRVRPRRRRPWRPLGKTPSQREPEVGTGPQGKLVWIARALPGCTHDLTAVRTHHLVKAYARSASRPGRHDPLPARRHVCGTGQTPAPRSAHRRAELARPGTFPAAVPHRTRSRHRQTLRISDHAHAAPTARRQQPKPPSGCTVLRPGSAAVGRRFRPGVRGGGRGSRAGGRCPGERQRLSGSLHAPGVDETGGRFRISAPNGGDWSAASCR